MRSTWKPIGAAVAETEDLIARAEQAGCVLMVDHTFLQHIDIEEIRADHHRRRTEWRCVYVDSSWFLSACSSRM